MNHRNAGGAMFLSSMEGVANILAGIAAFFGTGPMFSATKDWIYSFAAENYGLDFAEPAVWVWGGICALLIFFTARASLSTAIVFASVAAMTRFI